jgi:hypothetical protein
MKTTPSMVNSDKRVPVQVPVTSTWRVSTLLRLNAATEFGVGVPVTATCPLNCETVVETVSAAVIVWVAMEVKSGVGLTVDPEPSATGKGLEIVIGAPVGSTALDGMAPLASGFRKVVPAGF